jgi:hypothetical protein
MNSKSKEEAHVREEEAHGDVRGGKHRASFQEQIPCKLQDIIKNALRIPGEFKAYFVE